MAPRDQQNSAAKRKRPFDSTTVNKKDSSKKAAESPSKRAKSSSECKAQKCLSTVLSVAPLTVSSLKGPGKEETSFSRGGGSILTPLEYKEATNQALKDVLFETGAGGTASKGAGWDDVIAGEEKSNKAKRRKAEHQKKKEKKGTSESKEAPGPKVEGLSFKVQE